MARERGIDLRGPLKTSPALMPAMKAIRERVDHYEIDHYFSPDIEVICAAVRARIFTNMCPQLAALEA